MLTPTYNAELTESELAAISEQQGALGAKLTHYQIDFQNKASPKLSGEMVNTLKDGCRAIFEAAILTPRQKPGIHRDTVTKATINVARALETAIRNQDDWEKYPVAFDAKIALSKKLLGAAIFHAVEVGDAVEVDIAVPLSGAARGVR